jgi:hypothetical protein
MKLRHLYSWYVRYWTWRVANPTKPYEQYYADTIGRKVTKRGQHQVIGQHARAIRTATELLDLMRHHGLQPHHRFIDYGCGSLRLGKAVVEYLEPGNFHGMDVTQQFLDLGIEFLGADLVAGKSPTVAVITGENLAEAKARQPDYIGSWHVCSKVPDADLGRYFKSIIDLMTPTTQTFIQFPQMKRRMRMNGLNWSMSKDEFEAAVHEVAPSIKIDFFDITTENSKGVTETYAHLHY